MENALYLAAILTFGMGLVHSILGERYILTRLFRRDDLPELFGSADFTIRTMRFAWHLTTICWWGFGVILLLLAHPPLSLQTVGSVISIIFIVQFFIAIFGTRAKHLSWIIFLIVGICAFYATRA